MDKADFLKFDEALALKELGFDEPCVGYIQDNKERVLIDVFGMNTNSNFSRIFNEDKFRIVTPTYSQAFRWFREKYGYHIEIIWDHSENIIWYYAISKIGNIEFEHISSYPNNVTKTPEESELEGLKKLIEIVKKDAEGIH